jgi:DNA-binding transcriptional regulator YbjK
VTSPTDRRTAIADAAIATLARAGMRGFTHRAVDQEAGIPEGSTSYYFRTRLALLVAALDRLTELETPAAPISGDPVSMLTDALERRLTAGRERTLARYELTLEAARRPELRAKLIANGARFRAQAQDLLTALGAPNPERQGRDLVACLDGLVHDHLLGAGTRKPHRPDLRATCEDLLKAFTR